MPEPGDRTRSIQLGLLGAASAAFQTLLAREFLASFAGNEAVLAALLGPWLLWTALGARLGSLPSRAHRVGEAGAALIALGFLGPAALLAARTLPALFPAGSAPGPGTALAWAAGLLALPCLASGLAFARLARSAGGAWLAESVGSALAGAALSLVLLGRVPTFALAGAAATACGLAALLGSARSRALPCMAAALLPIFAVFLPGLGNRALRAQGAHLVDPIERDSASAALVLAGPPGGRTLYADRLPLVSGRDAEAAEELALVPAALHAAPRTAAVVGIPPAGALAALAAAGIGAPVVVLDDPGLLDAWREIEAPPVNARTEVADARRFLAERPAAFDLVLLCAPEPTSAQLNRLYTAEFFEAVRRSLRVDGILALALPGHAAYESMEKRRLHSSVARTLEAVFPRVQVWPTGRTLYLASEARLADPAEGPALVSRALDARSVARQALTRGYLDTQLTPARISEARQWSSLPEEPNRDLRPTTYRIALDAALAEFGDLGATPLLLLALALALGGLVAFQPRERPVEFAVMTSGAAGLSGQLVVMLAYQIAVGALYREIGLLLAGFMAGAAAGAFIEGRRARASARIVPLCDGLQAVLFAALGLALPTLVGLGPGAARAMAFAGALAVGLAPGAQFSAAGREKEGRAGALYAADLVGAAVAALATLSVLVPALGLRGTLFAVGALKLASLAVNALPRRQALVERPTSLAPLVPAALMVAVLAGAAERTEGTFYAFTFWRPYQVAAVLLLWLGILAAFEPARLREARLAFERRAAAVRARLRLTLDQAVSFLVLLPAGAFPLGRCYFHVPFVFCHVCPRQCVFGVLRPYAVPAALLANLYDHRFCERMCPLGAAQVACDGLRRARARRVRLLTLLRLASLAFVALAWFWAREGRGEGVAGGSFYGFFFRNAYAPSAVVLVLAAGALVLSLFVRRPFCEGLCPIGAASALLEPIEKRVATLLPTPPGGGPGPGEPPAPL